MDRHLNNGIGTYQWYDCSNNVYISGETSQSFAPTANGNYAVIVSNNGCADTSICYTISNSGISSPTMNPLKGISVYPNPTNGIIYLNSTSENSDLNLSIVDVNGKVIYNHSGLNGKSNMIDIEKLNQGVYFIKINNTQYQRIIKIVKQ